MGKPININLTPKFEKVAKQILDDVAGADFYCLSEAETIEIIAQTLKEVWCKTKGE